MTRVQVGKHVVVNIKRRSLCDNCQVVSCVDLRRCRVTECSEHVAPFLAFKKCSCCGQVFEVFSNFAALDYEICPECNLERIELARS